MVPVSNFNNMWDVRFVESYDVSMGVCKLVTRASSLVCGYEKRDGLIRSRLSSRKSFPKMESKIDLI